MTKFASLDDLFREELRVLYDAESQLIRALPLFARTANHPELKAAFLGHLQPTRLHVARLEQLFEALGDSPRGRKCHALAGLIAEAEEWMDREADPAVRDAGLIAKAQRIEYHEIAAYTCARTYARLLGHHDAEELLQSTLHEEAAANVQLAELSDHLNLRAQFIEQQN